MSHFFDIIHVTHNLFTYRLTLLDRNNLITPIRKACSCESQLLITQKTSSPHFFEFRHGAPRASDRQTRPLYCIQGKWVDPRVPIQTNYTGGRAWPNIQLLNQWSRVSRNTVLGPGSIFFHDFLVPSRFLFPTVTFRLKKSISCGKNDGRAIPFQFGVWFWHSSSGRLHKMPYLNSNAFGDERNTSDAVVKIWHLIKPSYPTKIMSKKVSFFIKPTFTFFYEMRLSCS